MNHNKHIKQVRKKLWRRHTNDSVRQIMFLCLIDRTCILFTSHLNQLCYSSLEKSKTSWRTHPTPKVVSMMIISRPQLNLGQGHHLHPRWQPEQYVLQGHDRRPITQPGEAFQGVKWNLWSLCPPSPSPRRQWRLLMDQFSSEIKRRLSSLLTISQVLLQRRKSKRFDQVY